jgi:hypothetical protein
MASISRFRGILALGLAALLFCAPLSLAAPARRSASRRLAVAPSKKLGSTIIHNHSGGEQAHLDQTVDVSIGFIIEQIGEMTSCREATKAELQRIRLANPDQPLYPVERAKTIRRKYDFQSHAAKSDDIPGVTANGTTGLTINFRESNQLKNHPDRAKVIAAFQRAAAEWESRIKNPISIIIDIDYGTTRFGQPFCPPEENPCNVLGSTNGGSLSGRSLSTIRNSLKASSSSQAETTLYNALPAGTAAPTNIGDAAFIVVSRPLTRALGLSGPDATETSDPFGTAPSIGFNENFPFDFNPDDIGFNDANNDGIENNKTDFDAVAVHEIGHALGFTSFVGYKELEPDDPNYISVWDLFRFAPGVTISSFPTAERWMSSGDTPSGNPVFFNNMGSGLKVSTAKPNGEGGDGEQSSHWKDDLSVVSNNIGIMDPTIRKGFRQRLKQPDLDALETFGYNLSGSVVTPVAPANNNFANAQVISGCTGSVTGSNESATKETGEPNNPNSPGSTKSVWYRWQAPGTGSVTIDTRGSNFDTTLAVYTGTSLGGLSLVTNNDDSEDLSTPDRDVTSLVSFSITAPGTIYYINVDGYNNEGLGGDTGSIKLNWTQGNCTATNPIDETNSFVRQHYLDFLDREPDAGGFAYWTNILNGCGADADCLNKVRVEISSRFFIELEFQRTGFFVMRLYQASFGQPPNFTQFIADRKNVQNTTESQRQFAAAWVARPAFLTQYPANLSAQDFVNQLYNMAGIANPTARADAINALNNAQKNRADVIFDLVELTEFQNREYNPTFVRMQYFGYLRRDIDPSGYNFWINVVNSTNNYRGMICAFVNSSEYQLRFHGTRGRFTELDCGW